jgi:hypothetical protein
VQKIQLTYWWNGHEPGDVVDVDDTAARELLGVIAQPAEDSEDPENSEDPGNSGASEDAGEEPESGR